MIAALTLAGVIFNGLIAVYVATRIRTPSGDTIGKVAERTHDNTAALTMAMMKTSGDNPGQSAGAERKTS